MGGLSYCNGTIQNNTIWHNIATNTGGGLSDCYGKICNCIIWANEAPGGGAQLYSPAIPTYSCIQDWTGSGMGNISLNPQFADPKNGNFHLQADSPCIDAGCLIEYLTTDYEGDTRGYDGTSEPRHDGSDYDIGAEEYSGVVPTPVTTLVPTSIYAPLISKLSDIFISDTEDNTETMDVNFFRFQNALDLDAYVSDLDTTIS